MKKSSKAPKEKPGTKKIAKKEEERIIQDKTFGLKNKNKSSKVQKYIKGVVLKVKTGGNLKGGESALIQKEMQAKAEHRKEEEKKALVDSLFKSISSMQQQQPKEGQDPKSILCSMFKAGCCKKGDNCRFSHDLDVGNKNVKMDIYTDIRDTNGMDNWSQDYLENVVKSKFRGRIKPSKEVCKHFIEALEKKTFGWLWECPNGDTCQYRHCLPPGYMLKADKEKADKFKTTIPLEEQLEFERAKLPTEGLTLVTLETFTAWKKKKTEEREKEKQEELAKESKKGSKFNSILSGRALFKFVPELFQDEDDAFEEYKGEVDTNGEETKAVEKQWAKEEKEAALTTEQLQSLKEQLAIEKKDAVVEKNEADDDGNEENKELCNDVEESKEECKDDEGNSGEINNEQENDRDDCEGDNDGEKEEGEVEGQDVVSDEAKDVK